MPIPDFQAYSVRTNLALFAGAAVIVWIAGTKLAHDADGTSERTNLGKAFLGLILPAVATSAEQRGGSSVSGDRSTPALLTYAALSALLAATDTSALFAGSLAMVLTCIYLVGLLERPDRTILRMGYDSAAVLVVYSAGLTGLYTLR